LSGRVWCPQSLEAVAAQAMKINTNLTQMLSRRQLATRWAVSKETLKRREKAGILPFLKLGRDVRYRLTDIELIEAQAEVRL